MIARGIKRITSLPKSIRLSLAVIGTGIASGLVGIFCHYLLEFIQVLAFGKDKESLLLQFQSVSAFRRLSVLLVVGVLSSLFWYFLQRRVTILSISKAKKLVGKRSPNFLGQSLHALIQVAIVAAGASIGKEGAPRELGALFGGSLSKELNLDISDRQLLIACGAGAGLASVYQVPFASALLVLEALGVSWTLKNIIIIFATTYVSAYGAKPIVGGHTLYTVDKVTIYYSWCTVSLPSYFYGKWTGFSSMDFFWELFSISSCHSHHQMSVGLSTFKEWCLWRNSDAIVCFRCRYGLSDNGASWKSWIFS